MRLGGIEKAEHAALVLPEAAARQRPEQTRDNGMQRPAIHKLLIEMQSGAGAIVLNGSSDPAGNRADRRRGVRLDGMPDERDLLLAGDIDRHVGKAALYLQPLVAHFTRQPVRVIVERLMENADDDEPAVAARRGFSELLEKIDVRIAESGMFEELAHFINDDNEARARRFGSGRLELLDHLAAGDASPLPATSWTVECVGDSQCRIRAAANDRQGCPPLASSLEKRQQLTCGRLPDRGTGLRPRAGVGAKQRRQRHGQT